MKQFDQQTSEYEEIISQANTQKQQLRNEIAVLEADVRTNRDTVADLQVENRNL
jgi:septal ring factor EnvC (AmiA/AmiB activator)